MKEENREIVKGFCEFVEGLINDRFDREYCQTLFRNYDDTKDKFIPLLKEATGDDEFKPRYEKVWGILRDYAVGTYNSGVEICLENSISDVETGERLYLLLVDIAKKMYL